MNSFTYFLATLTWLAGITIAKGFWAVTLAIFVPFYAWYLVVEHVLTLFAIV